MKKLLMILFPLLLLPVFSALAEPSVTFSPAAPRVGDYVDVIVTPDRESPQGYTYSLSLGEEAVYTGKDMSEHAAVSFRPRQEGVYTLTVTVTYGKKDQETASVTVPVSGEAPRQEGADVVYSQKDGWWHDKVYSKTYHRSVEKSGCALFALSHALQRMGHITDSAMPDALATRYSFCYVKDRGTSNEVLLTQAGKAFNFTTQSDLTESAAEIAACLNRGDLFSFDIVRSHIAMADGISEDGTKVHVVDSASGVTFERMVNGAVWIQAGDGSFVKAEKPEDLPGNRWFFETQEYAGMEYWLDLDYCAKRGMRLIRQPWLKLITEDGPVDVTLSQTGALISQVQLEDETLTVETRDLQWTSRGLEGPAVAMITKKGGTSLLDADDKKVPGFLKIPANTLLTVLEADKTRLYVPYKGKYGYISRSDVELIPVTSDDFQRGTVSVNGKTAGSVQITIRSQASAKSASLTKWKVGTSVAVLGKKDDFYQVEARGIRGWIQEKYLTVEDDSNGQKVDEGE